MCGIYGEIPLVPGLTVRSPESALHRLHHRGPDERGIWTGDGVSLGSCRLAVIDPAGGRQPIWNEDETLGIVYNGELYNFLDLRAELKGLGHAFRTRTDTEVVLHAYEEWGVASLDRMNGMFAYAIWDIRTRRAFLARDRLGEKPLYYFRDGRRLVFASEVKAILADPTVPREIDMRGLGNFLAFGHAMAPQTMLRGIRKLRPAHYLLVGGGRVDEVRYWNVGREPAEPVRSDDDYAEEVRTLLDDSVRRRLLADVPVGAFLSGGIDSSAVVALMRQHSSLPVKTFSLGFGQGPAYDELPDARRVATALGTEHHELRIHEVDTAELLPDLAYQYDEPFSDPAALPVYLLSRFARQHVTVVLTGEGGDELFGGYRRYAVDRLSHPYRRLPDIVTGRLAPALAEHLPGLRRTKRALRAMAVRDPGRRYALWLDVFGPDLRREILVPDAFAASADHDPAEPYARHYAALNGSSAADHLNRLMYTDLMTWLPDTYLEKVDKASMAWSLEARLPMLDHRLVELAFRIPGPRKVRGLSTKRILRRAVAPLVPAEVLRKRKHGFAVPTAMWLRGGLGDFARDVLLDRRALGRGYFEPRVVERLLREHRDGRHVRDQEIWALLNLELWHRAYLDGEALPKEAG